MEYVKDTKKLNKSPKTHYRALFEQSNDAIVISNMEGIIVDLNQKAADLLGYEIEELIGMIGAQLAVDYDPKFSSQTIDKLKADEEVPIYQRIFWRKDGTCFPAEVNAGLIRDNENNPQYFQILIRESSERKQAEKALQEKERRYRALFEQSNDAIILTSSESIVLDVNRKLGELLNYITDELVGMHVSQIVVNYDHEDSVQKAERLRAGEEIPIYYRIFRKKDGTEIPTEINCTLVRDVNNNPLYFQSLVRDITERKKAEEAIKDKELRYRTLFEQSNDAIFLINLDGFHLEANQKAAELLGYERNELIGMPIKQVVASHEHSDSLQKLKKLQVGEDFPIYVRFFRKKDGNEFPAEINATLVKDDEGNPLYIQSIVRDITGRKRAERALRETKDRYQMLVEKLHGGMLLEDVNGNFSFINPRGAEILGYTVEELIGQHWSITVPNEERIKVAEETAKRPEGISSTYETVVQRKNRQLINILVSGSPIFSESGEFEGTLSVFSDITERKQAEQALHESEQKFRVIADSALIGLAIVQENQVKYLNEALAQILGFPKNEILEWAINDIFKLIYREELPLIKKLVQKWISGEKKGKPDIVRRLQIRVITKMNEIRWVDVYIKTILYQEKPSFLVAIIDITERIQKEEELNKAYLELQDFASIVSHDLKAPLRGITTLAEWLVRDYSEKIDESGQELFNLLIKRVKRMHTLIDGILEYSKIGRESERIREINLNEIVINVIDLLAPPDHIEIMIESELPNIKGERTRFFQIFQNLISNAIRFMDKEQGVIAINCNDKKNFWEFYVADNGPGIPERYYKKIFQMFQTLNPQKYPENSGIGLALVRKIVQEYGGKIWVESSLRIGSTFWFTIPKQLQLPGRS